MKSKSRCQWFFRSSWVVITTIFLSHFSASAADAPLRNFKLLSEDIGLCRLSFEDHVGPFGARTPKYMEASTAPKYRLPEAESSSEDFEDGIDIGRIEERIQKGKKRQALIKRILGFKQQIRAIREDSGLDVSFHKLKTLHQVAEVKSALSTGEVERAANLLSDFFESRNALYVVIEATNTLEEIEAGIKRLEAKLSAEGLRSWRLTLERLKQGTYRPVLEKVGRRSDRRAIARLAKLHAMRAIQENTIVTNLELTARHSNLFLYGSQLLINTAQSKGVDNGGTEGIQIIREASYNGQIDSEDEHVGDAASQAARAVEVLRMLDEERVNLLIPGEEPAKDKADRIRKRILNRFLLPSLRRNPHSEHIRQQIEWVNSLTSVPELLLVEAIYLRDAYVKMAEGSILIQRIQKETALKIDKQYRDQLQKYAPIIQDMLDPVVTKVTNRVWGTKWIGDLWREMRARSILQQYLTRLAPVILNQRSDAKIRLKQLQDVTAGESPDKALEIYLTFYRMAVFRDVWSSLKNLFLEKIEVKKVEEKTEQAPSDIGAKVESKTEVEETLAHHGYRLKKDFEKSENSEDFGLLGLRMLKIEKMVRQDLADSPNDKTAMKFPDISPFNPTASATRRGTVKGGLAVLGLGLMFTFHANLGIDIMNAHAIKYLPTEGQAWVDNSPRWANTTMQVIVDRAIEEAKDSAAYREKVRRANPGTLTKLWNFTFGTMSFPGSETTPQSPTSGHTTSQSPYEGLNLPRGGNTGGFPTGGATYPPMNPSVPSKSPYSNPPSSTSTPYANPGVDTPTTTVPSSSSTSAAHMTFEERLAEIKRAPLPPTSRLRELIKGLTAEQIAEATAAWRAAKVASAP